MFRSDIFGDATSATAALYANSFRTVEASIGSTAIRTNGLLTDAVRVRSDPPALEFLVASRLRRNDVEFELSVGGYFTESAAAMASAIDSLALAPAQQVSLPASVRLELSLAETTRRRRSVRAYTGEPLTLRQLATIARSASGVTHTDGQAGGGREHLFRATASAGALYPIRLDLVALRVAGLERGVYSFAPREDCLVAIAGADVADSIVATAAAPDGPITVLRAAALCMLVGRPARSMRKYGARGMRHVFLEAGAMAHQINLTATALGIGSVDSSSFYDDEVHEALGIDGVDEALIHVLVLGIPAHDDD